MIRLNFMTVVALAISQDWGWKFLVQGGFDVGDYAEAYNLPADEINAQDVLDAQLAAANLNQDEWLEVSYCYPDASDKRF